MLNGAVGVREQTRPYTLFRYWKQHPAAAPGPACPQSRTASAPCRARQFATQRFLLTVLGKATAGFGKVDTLVDGWYGDKLLRERYQDILRRERQARKLGEQVDEEKQHAQQLSDAIIMRRNQTAAPELGIGSMALLVDEPKRRPGLTTTCDEQVALRLQLFRLKAQCILFQDKFPMSMEYPMEGWGVYPQRPDGMPRPLAPSFLKKREGLIARLPIYSLPRLVL
ncbi:NFX1-type zinc finger-containing protein 1 [Emericellopsis cladophorae]|uniref:NFX1-type zinc finger-containing protein 1 n=1 Tax=Emericellopsis cladophorae TaxID=2686198 RepID=A0A9P9XXI0_9HYPO|nr:NFX1-type zinc finger-containing protein 1 [Emericellopsis cladophorae]KAI6779373.1 NFX1-type zinc finger-containing protein 1 [Emericellopsis cladophorae]